MFHDVLLVVHDVLRVFHNVLQSLVSCATIGISDRVTANRCSDHRKSHTDRRLCRESDSMLNFVLNEDWSNCSWKTISKEDILWPVWKNTHIRWICNLVTYLRYCPDTIHLQKTYNSVPSKGANISMAIELDH